MIGDEYGIEERGSEVGVGEAVLKVIKKRREFEKERKFAVSFGDGGLNLRIEKMLN